ncbi:MAG: phosphoribosylformylglycinamidine synthase subunit PurQ [Pseudomonadota bacterium]
MKAKALVITGFGINCEEELNAAFSLSGFNSKIVFLNEILNDKVNIHEFDIIGFPGGFSFGDDLGSGKVLANKIRYKKIGNKETTLMDELKIFINDKKFILGICNGFQALVKMGLLPNIGGNFEAEVTLATNDSGKFENRWVKCKINENNSPFLTNIKSMDLPVRHGEGKLIIKDGTIKKLIIEKKLNCLTYCDEDLNESSMFPQNPNGAALNCAALINETGHVLGMMPHPEAFLSLYNHPNWGQIKRNNPNISEAGQGLKIFQNIFEAISIVNSSLDLDPLHFA